MSVQQNLDSSETDQIYNETEEERIAKEVKAHAVAEKKQFRTFAITVSPLVGDFDIEEVHRYMAVLVDSINCTDVWYAFEKGSGGDFNHFHAALFTPTYRTIGQIRAHVNTNYYAVYATNSNTRNMVVKHWYNVDWVNKYLTKEGFGLYHNKCQMVVNPDYSECQQYMLPPGDESLKKAFSGDRFYEDLETKIAVFFGPEFKVTEHHIDEYLRYCMYETRSMAVIRDPRIYNQTLMALTRYVTRDRSIPMPKRFHKRGNDEDREAEQIQWEERITKCKRKFVEQLEYHDSVKKRKYIERQPPISV